MVRRGSARPLPPRLPPDMPLHHDLRLAAGSEITGLTVQGDYAGAQLDGLFVEDSHVIRSSFIGADLRSLTLVDVLVEGSDFSGVDMEEASFTRVTFKDCRMSGARIPRTRLRDVTFCEVRLEDANFRMTSGERVFFDHTNLVRADFYAAHLASTWVFDCDLNAADVTKARLPGSRLHGSILSDLKGGESLRGVVIDSSQVLPLALDVFAALNIRIDDERDAPSP